MIGRSNHMVEKAELIPKAHETNENFYLKKKKQTFLSPYLLQVEIVDVELIKEISYEMFPIPRYTLKFPLNEFTKRHLALLTWFIIIPKGVVNFQ